MKYSIHVLHRFAPLLGCLLPALIFVISFWFCLSFSWLLFLIIIVGFRQSFCDYLCNDCLCRLSWWGMYSLCDVLVLGGRAIANWTLSSNGRIRHRVFNVKSSQSCTRTTVGLPIFMRLSNVVFLVSHRNFKALDVGVCVLCHAIRCLFDYMNI